MPHSIHDHANHTARILRRVLAVVGCSSVASFYFGYWFSH